MCSIGTLVAVPICTAVSGATDAPMTTTTAAAPCEDYYSNCGDYASYCDVWGDSFTTACPVTCNTCQIISPCLETLFNLVEKLLPNGKIIYFNSCSFIISY